MTDEQRAETSPSQSAFMGAVPDPFDPTIRYTFTLDGSWYRCKELCELAIGWERVQPFDVPTSILRDTALAVRNFLEHVDD